MFRRYFVRLCSVLTLAAVLITGCGGSDTSKQPASADSKGAVAPTLVELAKKEGKVVVFSPSKGALMDNMAATFKKKYGIDVENVYAGSTQIINRIRAEKDNPTGDVWVGAGGIIPFLVAKKEGVLEPYAIQGYKVPETAGEIVLRDKDHFFNAAWILTLGWTYNTQKGKPGDIPADLSGFLDPKWKNQVEMSDPAASGTAVLFIMSEIQKFRNAGKPEAEAWDLLKKFAAQVKRFPESGGGPSADVAKGDVAAGLAFDQQAYLMKGKKEPVDWVLPKNTPVVIDPAGIIKKAPHPNAAKLYMEFLLSMEGQELVAKDGPFLSVRPDVKLSPLFNNTFEDYAKNALKLDLNWLEANFDSVQQKWRTEVAAKK